MAQRCKRPRTSLGPGKLQTLLNHGAFEMVGRFDDMSDRYGRDLRVIRRKRAEAAISRSPTTFAKAG